ncbi:TerB family tellurite resistance protein [Azospirillum sp. CT11-132]|uniref:TerB family tellurite resistance protein n=1 Tax=Azospirillum sp. CT11-132 TaxID=3396317 RepID=UPI0039A723C9
MTDLWQQSMSSAISAFTAALSTPFAAFQPGAGMKGGQSHHADVAAQSTGDLASKIAITSPIAPMNMLPDAATYSIDAWQRWILLLDVLRRRGDQFIEHAEQGKPPVLTFAHEMVLDGRHLKRPCNYMLLRIKPAPGIEIDPAKRPFVIVDPRAGHGPGIGGFKPDSQIGAALQAGHPCYFVGFHPEPVPGQTLSDVAAAEATFLEHVSALHEACASKPCVIGNCQAGWAVMALSAARPDLMGPIIIAGSPLSYWAGVKGQNPMRYLGGLYGGAWLAALAGDLGNGRFDGAHLIGNFEKLDPANTLWKKMYNLYASIDTEAERYLAFERWWGGYFLLNSEEIEAITDELFVGNKLTAGSIVGKDGRRLDLRNIRSPILVFASWGDNITPPQQALGWILDLYDSVDEIRAHEQTIVYNLHQDIGHLGIFVSGRVARKETAEFIENIDLIDLLPPGLYEMTIHPKDPDIPGADLIGGNYLSRFEPRTLDDIRHLGGNTTEDDQRFATVARVSDINKGLYVTFGRPQIRAAVSEPFAQWLRLTNPVRMQHYLFSHLNPFMAPIESLADWVRENRRPVGPDNAFLTAEETVSEFIVRSLNAYRDQRDHFVERLFLDLYGSPLLQALVGLSAPGGSARPPRTRDEAFEALVEKKKAEIMGRASSGGFTEALFRVLAYAGRSREAIDERSFQMLRRIRDEHPGSAKRPLGEVREIFREQAFLMQMDEAGALASLPALIPEAEQRKELLAIAERVLTAAGPLTTEQRSRLRKLELLLAGETKPSDSARRLMAAARDNPLHQAADELAHDGGKRGGKNDGSTAVRRAEPPTKVT